MNNNAPSVWDLPLPACIECEGMLDDPRDDLCVTCAILERMVSSGEVD
jgi:hypothetical protein